MAEPVLLAAAIIGVIGIAVLILVVWKQLALLRSQLELLKQVCEQQHHATKEAIAQHQSSVVKSLEASAQEASARAESMTTALKSAVESHVASQRSLADAFVGQMRDANEAQRTAVRQLTDQTCTGLSRLAAVVEKSATAIQDTYSDGVTALRSDLSGGFAQTSSAMDKGLHEVAASGKENTEQVTQALHEVAAAQRDTSVTLQGIRQMQQRSDEQVEQMRKRLVAHASKLSQKEQHQLATVTHEVKQTESELRLLRDRTARLADELSCLTDQPVSMRSPISRLTFQESLSPSVFMDATKSASIDSINSLLNANIGDVGSITVQTISILNGSPQMVLEFSAKGEALRQIGVAYRATDSSGKMLPMLKDVATGKWIEQGRVVEKAGQLTSKLANIASIVVAVSHVISGADVVRRLKKIEKQLQYLVACRKFDQMARLEGIYGYARELLSRPQDFRTRDELMAMRRDVMEIRSVWRQELRFRMDNVSDPSQAAWHQRWFTRTKTTDRTLVEAISEGELEVAMIEYALRLDLALAAASGSLESFFELTLPSELNDVKGLERLIRSKAAYISGKHPELSADHVADRLAELSEAYAAMLDGQGGTKLLE